jgi:hypothetical protein
VRKLPAGGIEWRFHLRGFDKWWFHLGRLHKWGFHIRGFDKRRFHLRRWGHHPSRYHDPERSEQSHLFHQR